jgi:diamine N-acetyltransferase
LNTLKGKHVLLRAPEPEDLDVLYLWENDQEIWQVSDTLLPFSKFELRNYIENSRHDIYEAKQMRFMVDLKEIDSVKTIGTVDLFDFDPFHSRVGVGILIGDLDARRKGYANESLRILMDYCFNTLLIHQIFCNILSDNTESLNLFQNNGFSVSGEKKHWIKTKEGWKDELFLQIINH